jgi:hypothetical protein
MVASALLLSCKLTTVHVSMLLQFPTDAAGIVFLVLAIVLLFVFNYLAVRWIESKEMARRKKGACFFAGLLGVLMFIFVLMGWNAVFGVVNNWIPEIQWPNAQPLLALGPMIVFLIYIAIVHGLIGTDWKKSISISILSMLLLAAFLAFTPYAAQYLQFY